MAQDPYRYFRVEARELAEQLGQGVLDLEKGQGGTEGVARLLRVAHTLKGAARVVRRVAVRHDAVRYVGHHHGANNAAVTRASLFSNAGLSANLAVGVVISGIEMNAVQFESLVRP